MEHQQETTHFEPHCVDSHTQPQNKVINFICILFKYILQTSDVTEDFLRQSFSNKIQGSKCRETLCENMVNNPLNLSTETPW